MAKWLKTWLPVLALIVVTFVGEGFYWQWQQSRLEAKKHDLATIAETTDLWKQENDLLAKIIDLSNEYIKAQDKYSKTPRNELHNRMVQQTSQLELMKDAFTALEAKLAHLEDRAPRDISLQFIPPSAPQLITVTTE